MIVTFLRGGRAHLSQKTTDEPKPRYLDGFRYLMKAPLLRVLVLFFALMLLVLQMVDSQFVILLRPLPNASRLLGITMSASGVGMAVAAIVLQKVRVARPLGWMAVAAMAIGFGFGGAALLAGAHLGWGVPLVVFLAGGSAAVAMIPFQTAVQQETPVEWTGRVQSAVGTVSSISVVAGPILGGLLIQRVSVTPAFLLVSALLVLVGITGSVISWSHKGAQNAQSESTTQDGTSGATHLGG